MDFTFKDDRIFDALKWATQIAIPAFGTFYFALASIWGLPYGEQIVGTLTAIDTLLGVCLGISTAQYNQKGAKLNGKS